MCRAFPDHIVQCHGDGRVTAVNVMVKPMSYIDISDALFSMQSELDSLQAEVAKLRRTQELLFHNLAALNYQRVSCSKRQPTSYHAGYMTHFSHDLRFLSPWVPDTLF